MERCCAIQEAVAQGMADVRAEFDSTKTCEMDAGGQPVAGSSRDAVRFEPCRLPPVNAFRSLPPCELPAGLLSANPIDRRQIDATKLPGLRQDGDGG